jgi:ABC-type sugar transport system ATPase subunit
LLAKWITTNPKLLIVDEPTRGVDVGAKAKIHSILRDLAEAGLGIIMISSELPEILGLSDRVAVMNNGKLITVLDNNDLSEEMILNKAFNKHVVGL